MNGITIIFLCYVGPVIIAHAIHAAKGGNR
jgi:hypothetical protein